MDQPTEATATDRNQWNRVSSTSAPETRYAPAQYRHRASEGTSPEGRVEDGICGRPSNGPRFSSALLQQHHSGGGSGVHSEGVWFWTLSEVCCLWAVPKTEVFCLDWAKHGSAHIVLNHH